MLTHYFIVFILHLVYTYAADDTGDCPPGWTYNPSDQHCYQLFTTYINYTDARSACHRLGADIPAQKSKDTVEFLLTLSGRPSYYTPWVPVTNTTGTGWKWEDGEPLSWSYWRSGYPNAPADFHCVVSGMYLSQHGLWQDRACYDENPYICGRPASGNKHINQVKYKIV